MPNLASMSWACRSPAEPLPPEPTPAPAGLASLLPTIRPQLAYVRAAPPLGDRWLHEIKFDGYRTMAYVEQESVRLITRNGLDWTRHYGHLASAFQGLRCRQAILDGEVAVQDAAGVTSVPALEQAIAERQTEQLIFYAFDLLTATTYGRSPYCSARPLWPLSSARPSRPRACRSASTSSAAGRRCSIRSAGWT